MVKSKKPRTATTFSLNGIRKKMKKSGGELVSMDGVKTLEKQLVVNTTKLTKKALEFAKNSKRKIVNDRDIALAIKYLK